MSKLVQDLGEFVKDHWGELTDQERDQVMQMARDRKTVLIISDKCDCWPLLCFVSSTKLTKKRVDEISKAMEKKKLPANVVVVKQG